MSTDPHRLTASQWRALRTIAKVSHNGAVGYHAGTGVHRQSCRRLAGLGLAIYFPEILGEVNVRVTEAGREYARNHDESSPRIYP